MTRYEHAGCGLDCAACHLVRVADRVRELEQVGLVTDGDYRALGDATRALDNNQTKAVA